MATLSHTQWCFVREKSAGDRQGVVWILNFHSPRTAALDRQGLALSGRYARQFGPPLFIGYSQLTYTCIYTCTPTDKYSYTHIYKFIGYPPPADAPHCRCQLPAQTLKLRILQQPGYQDQVVGSSAATCDSRYLIQSISSNCPQFRITCILPPFPYL